MATARPRSPIVGVVNDLADHLYVHYAGSAVEHLFRVAAGMDSVVVGETQILGQLRAAYGEASRLGSVGTVLHKLAQQSLRVGKRVHAEAGINAASRSLVSEALAEAAAAIGSLRGRRALIVGAGAMAALAAAELRRCGVAEIAVANRTFATACRLAATVAAEGTSARGVGLEAVPAELAAADIVPSRPGPAYGMPCPLGRGGGGPKLRLAGMSGTNATVMLVVWYGAA